MALVTYKPDAVQDLFIVQWYGQMIVDDDFYNTFMLNGLSGLFEFFKAPRTLVYDKDEKGIWYAAWYDPSAFSGAFFGLWSRKDKRSTKQVVEHTLEALDQGLQRWPVLIGVTKQERLLDSHRKLGYNVAGKIPSIWAGEDAWVVYITRELFDQREAYVRRRSDKWAAENQEEGNPKAAPLQSSERLLGSS